MGDKFDEILAALASLQKLVAETKASSAKAHAELSKDSDAKIAALTKAKVCAHCTAVASSSPAN